jgi:hypothetical protein
MNATTMRGRTPNLVLGGLSFLIWLNWRPTGNATYIHKRKRSPLISTDNEHKRDNGGADHYQPDSSQEHRPPRRQITVPPNMANMFAYHTG